MNARRMMMLREASKGGNEYSRNYDNDYMMPEDRYRDSRGRYAATYDYRYDPWDNRRMIGFDDDVETGRERGAVMTLPYKSREAQKKSSMTAGYAESDMDYPRITPKIAEKWAEEFCNEDGSKGAHWTMDQTQSQMESRRFNLDKAEFFLVMNMLYSDFCKVFKRYGLDKPEFYADLAKAWIEDEDAVENKVAVYFCNIPKD